MSITRHCFGKFQHGGSPDRVGAEVIDSDQLAHDAIAPTSLRIRKSSPISAAALSIGQNHQRPRLGEIVFKTTRSASA